MAAAEGPVKVYNRTSVAAAEAPYMCISMKKNGGTPVQVYKNRYKHMTNPSMVLPKLLNKCRYITVQKKVYISNGTTIPCAMYQCKKRKCTKFVLYTYLV